MPQYESPGVYVEEVPSGLNAIVGVSTSTAGFIGAVPAKIEYKKIENRRLGFSRKQAKDTFELPQEADQGSFVAKVGTDSLSPIWDPEKPGQVSFDTSGKEAGIPITATYTPIVEPETGVAKLCTSFGDFKRQFGDFSPDPGQNRLAHAVYGFFNNGGSRCYVWAVVEGSGEPDIGDALTGFEAIDEIALVAVPGMTGKSTAVINHCERLGDRFAILDCANSATVTAPSAPGNSNYAAFYMPWIEVFDPASGKNVEVPPSGHLAGVYARVDSERGVHKAPANEVVRGALGLTQPITKAQQAGLNPKGVNCIRHLNGNIRVWGARTLGGDANGEWKYVSVRRLFLYLRESIDEGTQWVVFEPNSSALWAQITRNVTGFLTNVWRSGALFGATPEEAFYVKCDAETNPPEVRDAGRVVTEIGVAPVKPAEFVIFRISQWAGPGK